MTWSTDEMCRQLRRIEEGRPGPDDSDLLAYLQSEGLTSRCAQHRGGAPSQYVLTFAGRRFFLDNRNDSTSNT